MTTLYATIGLPACGKSSLGKQMEVLNKNLRMVSKDDIRRMLYGEAKWVQSREPLVVETESELAHSLLEKGYDVYVHDTNLAEGHIDRLREISFVNGSKFEIVDLRFIPIMECIKRDALRENSVGYRVILGMAERHLTDMYNEFRIKYPDNQLILDELYIQRNSEIDNAKLNAVVVDIDGTLAIVGNRSPYDLSLVKYDKVYQPLALLLESLSEHYTILYLSGREDSCYAQTREWLEMNHLWHFDSTLLMRSAKDRRSDAIVKEEIWRKHIEPLYNTICVFDDRKQVIEMWRKLGLFTCQVNWGDF